MKKSHTPFTQMALTSLLAVLNQTNAQHQRLHFRQPARANGENGEKVRWYLLGMGNEVDMHSPHWHGKVVRYNQRNTDVIELIPGSMATADMLADNPGTWMFHCYVADHIDAGMLTTWTITP